MLQMLRSAAGTWVAKLLLLLLVASFAVWGVSGQIAGDGGDEVVVAGDASASLTDYRLAYDRQVMSLSRQFGQRITREQARSLGLDNQALAQVVSGTLLDAHAEDLGLGLSQVRLAQMAGADPTFRGADGRFDRRIFDAVLRDAGMRPEDYLRNQSQAAVRQQLVAAIADGGNVPDVFLSAVARYRGERRNAEFVEITPAALPEPAVPSDEALSAWYEENSSRFDAPEYRNVSVLVLDPQSIADPEAVDDDQIAAEYERTKERYGQPERRTVEQILYPDREAAEAALAKLEAGDGFDTLLEDAGRTASQASLGAVAQSDIADDAIANAAFALDEAGTTGIVDGNFGPAILRVTDIEPAAARPLPEVSDEIRQELALAQANRTLLDSYDAYEDARAAGETMAEAAERIGAPVRRIEALDAQGQGLDGQPIGDLPDADGLINEIFQADEGIENPAVNLAGDGFVFYEVNSVTPTRSRTLDEVREEALEVYQSEQAAGAVEELAGTIVDRVDGGASLSSIAEELGLQLRQADDLKRDSQREDLGANAIEAVFSVPDGKAGQSQAANAQARIVFHVTEVFPPVANGADTVAEAEQENFDRALSNDLLDQLVERLQTQYRPTINRTAAERALSF